MTKELSQEKALEIKLQIDEIFFSNDVSHTDIMSILCATVMSYIRRATSNDKNDNLKEAKYFCETMIKVFGL